MIRHPPKSTFFPYTPLFQSICKACKDKLVPNMAPSSSLQVAGAAVGSSSPIPNHFSRGETVAKTANFWRRMLKRSEEHTSELQSLRHLVCRLLLEKKKPSTPPTASLWPPRYFVLLCITISAPKVNACWVAGLAEVFSMPISTV